MCTNRSFANKRNGFKKERQFTNPFKPYVEASVDRKQYLEQKVKYR